MPGTPDVSAIHSKIPFEMEPADRPARSMSHERVEPCWLWAISGSAVPASVARSGRFPRYTAMGGVR